jgi:hypothetical protein
MFIFVALALLASLVTKELFRTAKSVDAERIGKLLYIPIVILLVLFIVVAIFDVAPIWSLPGG